MLTFLINTVTRPGRILLCVALAVALVDFAPWVFLRTTGALLLVACLAGVCGFLAVDLYRPFMLDEKMDLSRWKRWF